MKKMTRFDDPRLEGCHPEFARMSLKPGIGFDALHEIASTLMQYDLDETLIDVPSAMRVGDKLKPLGRYLQGGLRELVGKDKKAPRAVIEQAACEVFDLYMAARASKELPSFKAHLINAQSQRVATLKGRVEMFEQRKKL